MPRHRSIKDDGSLNSSGRAKPLAMKKKMKKTNGLLVSVLFLITGLSTPLTLVLFLAVKRNTGSWQITRKSGEVR